MLCYVVPDVQGPTDLSNFDEYAMTNDLFNGDPYNHTAGDWDQDF